MKIVEDKIRWALLVLNLAGAALVTYIGWCFFLGDIENPDIPLVTDFSDFVVGDEGPRPVSYVALYDSITLVLEPPPPPPREEDPEEETAAEDHGGTEEGGPLEEEWELTMTLGWDDPLRRAALLKKKESSQYRTVGRRRVVMGTTRTIRRRTSRTRRTSRRPRESVLVYPGETYELLKGGEVTVERVTVEPEASLYYEHDGNTYVLTRDEEEEGRPWILKPEDEDRKLKEVRSPAL